MGFLDRVFGRKATQLTYDQIADLIDGRGGGRVAGVTVNEKTALQVATVLACVRVLADGCATPALRVYREKSGGQREHATNIPECRLLERRPNEWQTSFGWRRMMTLHAALTGAGLSIKVKGDNNRVQELIPIDPGNWTCQKRGRYDLVYRCWDEWGIIGEFKPDEVFVLHGLQWNWAQHLDAVKLAAQAIGLSIAAERSQIKLHENGLRPSGIYTVDGTLSQEQYERLTKRLRNQGGVDNTGTPLVLDRAAKWIGNVITSVDAQANETRRTQIEEICRGYGVFPIMVGHSDKTATFASTESFFAAHLIHSLAPWHVNWKQECDEMLLDGAGPLFVDFDTRYMVAGSMKDQSVYARTMVEMGLLSPNEWRDMVGLDPRPGGDTYLTPMNMSAGGAKGPSNEDPAQQG